MLEPNKKPAPKRDGPAAIMRRVHAADDAGAPVFVNLVSTRGTTLVPPPNAEAITGPARRLGDACRL